MNAFTRFWRWLLLIDDDEKITVADVRIIGPDPEDEDALLGRVGGLVYSGSGTVWHNVTDGHRPGTRTEMALGSAAWAWRRLHRKEHRKDVI